MIGRTNTGGGGKSPYGLLTVNYPSDTETISVTNVQSKYKQLVSTGDTYTRLYYVNEPASGTSIDCVVTISKTGAATQTRTVSFTEEGQGLEVTIPPEYVLVDDGTVVVTPTQSKPSGGSGTYTYDMTDGAKVTCSAGTVNRYCMYWTVDATNYDTLTITVDYDLNNYNVGYYDVSDTLNGNYYDTNYLNYVIVTKSGATHLTGTTELELDISNYSGTLYIRFGFRGGTGALKSSITVTDMRLS